MIYTVTLNPCVDCYVYTDKTEYGKTNRAERIAAVPGGKGVNVSVALKRLGIESKALLLCGGRTGQTVTDGLESEGIPYEAVETAADTRINVKLVCGGAVTEINAPGGPVTEDESRRFTALLHNVGKDDVVILSGSCAQGINRGAVLGAIKASGAYFAADTSGAFLKECAAASPDLIKPNYAELCALLGYEPGKDGLEAALAGIPAKAVLLSDGEKGAYLYENGSLCHLPVNGAGFTVKNATGAGDSMIAGYLYGKRTGADPLACAVSAGSATAYCDGIFDKETFDRVLETYEGRI